MTDDIITHPETNPIEAAALEERRRELADHYYECRKLHPIVPDFEVIE